MFTILVTFLTVIADQITKYFVCINMDLGETIPVIKNVVHLTYIINPGAAFGLFPHQDVLFLGIVMILLLAFAWLRNRIPQKPVYFPLKIDPAVSLHLQQTPSKHSDSFNHVSKNKMQYMPHLYKSQYPPR